MSPIFNNGSKSDLNNYRPISLIPTVAKIFEKIVYDQLYQYLDENGLLNSDQSGLRSLHSTLTALLETTIAGVSNLSYKIVKNCRMIGLHRAKKNKFCPRSV